MQKAIRMLGITVAISLLAFVLGMVSAQDNAKVLVTGISMVGGDLETIDPGRSETSSSIEVVNQLFVGLTAQNVATGGSVLGLAESYDVSEDGKTFTFKMRQDVPWVRYNADSGAVEELKDDAGNVRFVNAQDVYNGMVRALDPVTASPYAYVLAKYVVNGVEFNTVPAEPDPEATVDPEATEMPAAPMVTADQLGIKVVDDFTLEVSSPDPVSFAPSIYGLWVSRPVPSWLIEEYGDSWTEPENIATNGPFALKEWAHEQSLTIIKNPFWPGTDDIPQAKLDEVTFRFLDPTAAFAEYQSGTMDAITIPVEEIERVKADSTLSTEYVTGTTPCTYYIGFDNTEDPMTNANLRRALSLAVDRQSIVDNVTKGGQIPAQWFSRPGLAAAPTMDNSPDLGIKYDPEAAKAALALALKDLGLNDVSELPPLTLTYNGAAGHQAIMQAVQQMWVETLGIQVELATLEPTTYFSSISEDAPMMYRAGWCQDYSDANNFLYDVFYSKSSQNDPGFSDPDYDKLVTEARTEPDESKRLALYQQAEDILVNQKAAIIPIYWYTTNQLIKPYVEYVASITGNEAYNLWDVTR
jgi:oligopeptide transport system substrate-binding protein